MIDLAATFGLVMKVIAAVREYKVIYEAADGSTVGVGAYVDGRREALFAAIKELDIAIGLRRPDPPKETST